jgi:hypothetical protein
MNSERTMGAGWSAVVPTTDAQKMAVPNVDFMTRSIAYQALLRARARVFLDREVPRGAITAPL